MARVSIVITILLTLMGVGLAKNAISMERIPAPLISIGDNGYAIVVEKSTHHLYIYDSHYNVIQNITVTTGKRHGNKMIAGDLKTPEGIYFITDVMEKKELLPKYGVMALTINYPNLIDRQKLKKGSGIWLHATDDPSRLLKPFDSRGCVVTINEDMLEIAKHIDLETTPIVIVDKISYTPLDRIKTERQELIRFLKKWEDAWENKEISQYISLYSKDFHSQGMDLQGWRRYKQRVNNASSYIDIDTKDVWVLKYVDYMVVLFRQDYKSNIYKDTGIKRLYITFDNGKPVIVGEEWKPIPSKGSKMAAKRYIERSTRHMLNKTKERGV